MNELKKKAQKMFDRYSRSEEAIANRAMVVFDLSVKRAGKRCPKWARTNSFRRKFLKIYKKAQYKNRFCSYKVGDRFHVDHIIPLHGDNVSGLHVPWNLHVIPATVNIAKGTLIVEEYMR